MKTINSFKNTTILLAILSATNFSLKATTTYTVGASGGSYTTISAAYAACSGATDYVIELRSNYAYNTETSTGANTITLGTLTNKSSVNTVTIRPQTGVSFTFTATGTSMFTLNGADWIIFDGRAAGIGASALTLVNTSTAGGANVFKFQADATNNTIQYLTLKGSGTSTGAPICFGSGTTTGNTNNTITYNHITKSTAGIPAYGIYSYGTSAGVNNSTITISNNNFYDLGQGSWCGIVMYSNSWTVTANNFYQTATISLTSADLYMIYVGSNCVSVTITNNYFGGRAVSCGGAAFTITTGSYQLTGVEFNSVTGTVSILSNTFANITTTSTGNNSLVCIETYGSAAYTIGSLGNGNTFGSTSATASIRITGSTASTTFSAIRHWGTNASNSIRYNTFAGITQTHTTASTFPAFYGIYIGLSTQGTISNNTFGATSGPIQLTGTGVGISYHALSWVSNSNATMSSNTFQNFTVSNGASTGDNAIIYVSGSGTNTIANNTIGSTTANNMSFGSADFVSAIHNYSSGTTTISGNTIQQFTQTGTGSSAGFTGVLVEFNSGISTINNNTIKNITTAGTGSSAFKGISLESTNASATNSITENTIDLITASSAVAATVVGIWVIDGGGTVQRNTIKRITFNSSNASANLFGIAVDAADNLNFYNNVVLLDNGSASPILRGILNRSGSSNTFNFYHNTIKIFGTATSGANNSNAFTDMNSAGSTINVRNNIFQNVRTNSGGTGTHIAIRFTSNAPTITSDYNYIQASGTGGLFGVWNATNYATIALYRTASSKEANSKNSTITINSFGQVPGGTTSDVKTTGTNLSATVPVDILGATRATTPWMGAYEDIIALPIVLISFEGVKAGDENILTWSTITEINNDYFTIEKTEDGETFEIVGILNGSGSSSILNEYRIVDYNVQKRINYYRLKQTDFDGKYTYTDLISIENSDRKENKTIRFKTNLLGQEISSDHRGIVIITYVDGSSQKILQ